MKSEIYVILTKVCLHEWNKTTSGGGVEVYVNEDNLSKEAIQLMHTLELKKKYPPEDGWTGHDAYAEVIKDELIKFAGWT